ncbi:PREDICTED: uncharacterized protein LOC106748181 [Dinoponera quadriceps]|uniref:Uncharacterized protein LOC106748181 n=1 Tax=Dinoponera quadriceps TaxID=609295 RepID=A0A6P3XUY9_DINQU|nr:PREDICTED: uncharacterized protein LOC106748181 [Dinoponera quadriceps]
MCAIGDLEAFPRSVLILVRGPTSSKFPVGLEGIVVKDAVADPINFARPLERSNQAMKAQRDNADTSRDTSRINDEKHTTSEGCAQSAQVMSQFLIPSTSTFETQSSGAVLPITGRFMLSLFQHATKCSELIMTSLTSAICYFNILQYLINYNVGTASSTICKSPGVFQLQRPCTHFLRISNCNKSWEQYCKTKNSTI